MYSALVGFLCKIVSSVHGYGQDIQVSQEECARLRESVPYVKVYRYNPKHLYPKLNGYGDNGQRKLWSSCGSTYCTCSADLNESFPNCWLGRGGPVAWPPRSPDLTPLDYYLWGHMKTLVYETKVESRAALRDRSFAAAEHIRNHPDNIASATQSLLMRAENCIATGGGHFEQLL